MRSFIGWVREGSSLACRVEHHMVEESSVAVLEKKANRSKKRTEKKKPIEEWE